MVASSGMFFQSSLGLASLLRVHPARLSYPCAASVFLGAGSPEHLRVLPLAGRLHRSRAPLSHFRSMQPKPAEPLLTHTVGLAPVGLDGISFLDVTQQSTWLLESLCWLLFLLSQLPRFQKLCWCLLRSSLKPALGIVVCGFSLMGLMNKNLGLSMYENLSQDHSRSPTRAQGHRLGDPSSSCSGTICSSSLQIFDASLLHVWATGSSVLTAPQK